MKSIAARIPNFRGFLELCILAVVTVCGVVIDYWRLAPLPWFLPSAMMLIAFVFYGVVGLLISRLFVRKVMMRRPASLHLVSPLTSFLDCLVVAVLGLFIPKGADQ